MHTYIRAHFSLQKPSHEFLMRASYMEIYNERIFDLLSLEERNLKLHESVVRPNDTYCFCTCTISLALWGEGRKVGDTNMKIFISSDLMLGIKKWLK